MGVLNGPKIEIFPDFAVAQDTAYHISRKGKLLDRFSRKVGGILTILNKLEWPFGRKE